MSVSFVFHRKGRATSQKVALIGAETVVGAQPVRVSGEISANSIASFIRFLDAIDLPFQISILLLLLPQRNRVLVGLSRIEQVNQKLRERPED